MRLFLRFFELANTSGSGELTFLEFNTGLQLLHKTPLGKLMNGQEFKQVRSMALSTFEKLDVDKDGVLTHNEIRHYIRKRLQSHRRSPGRHRRKLSLTEAKMHRQSTRSPFSEYLSDVDRGEFKQ